MLIAHLCRKINRKISVSNRFKRPIPFNAKINLFNSFIPSHLNYCSVVWHFCLKIDSDKLEKLNERALRSVFQDKTSQYERLLEKGKNTTIYNRRLHNLATLVYKALNNQDPLYTCRQDLFKSESLNIIYKAQIF